MKTAMILAAGRGERLKPLTDKVPKALCIVQDKPLIEHHIEKLVQAGFGHLVINHAYLGSQIRRKIGHGSRWGVDISYSAEPPGGLETGGGIVKALPLLGNEPFITVNADIYTDFDFKHLPRAELTYLHLVLTKKNPELGHHGDFGLVNARQLTNTPREYTFAGIACYNPEIFQGLPQGRYSVSHLMRDYAQAGKASAELYEGVWFDIGSLERLKAVNDFLKRH
ncbi:N-acetylmuramate alpha-1-phosphate uridylyltransferase MurU [Legionella sp. km772]|uniref:N-acetylmuramate alpha-1-phosphate uridylyltransferase MurU n=1 Tax=Legionella sp. km772 TaxID=2498111 RepID=UPI000F8D4E03|nr:nucleotidyltransferase family protein [Legionella sp. km772]RUR12448.1 nucleotidyltransferase family protein [Legionella sp. km772]